MRHTSPKHDRVSPRSWFSLFRAQGGWWALGAAVVCLAVTFWSVGQYRAAAQYEAVGLVTKATAVDRRWVSDSDSGDTYYVTYRFAVGPEIVQRERTVSKGQYNRATTGTLHEIRYLPDNPRKFETYVGEAHDDAVVLQWVAGGAGSIGLIALWFAGSRANRSVLTRRYGYRSVARVDQIVETKNSGEPSGYGYLIWYTDNKKRGESLMHPIGKLNDIGVGAEINVYIRKGHSVWEGDVGPQETRDSRFPKVPPS
ncbi:MAG: DUF3592 domain-containing protein [Pseudomonadota bacterium]